MQNSEINIGKGMVRHHELVDELRTDIDLGYVNLEKDRQSQYLRRCVARAIFAFIEALIESIKVEIRSNIRTGLIVVTLTKREMETLGSLSITPRSSGKFLPLDQNIKRTFRLAAKIWKLNFQLESGGQDFQDFLAAKSARNRLTHPRTFYDIQVSDDDMEYYTIAGSFIQQEFLRLMNARKKQLQNF